VRSPATAGPGAARRGLERADPTGLAREPAGLRRAQVWKQLRREGYAVARCTVARLMDTSAWPGCVRRHRFTVTTRPAPAPAWPSGLVSRQFRVQRPNELWIADLTYVATLREVVYVALVIDVFSRRIVGWRVSTSLRSDLVLEAWSRRCTSVAAPWP